MIPVKRPKRYWTNFVRIRSHRSRLAFREVLSECVIPRWQGDSTTRQFSAIQDTVSGSAGRGVEFNTRNRREIDTQLRLVKNFAGQLEPSRRPGIRDVKSPARPGRQQLNGGFSEVVGRSGCAMLVVHHLQRFALPRQPQHGFDEVAPFSATAPNAVQAAGTDH